MCLKASSDPGVNLERSNKLESCTRHRKSVNADPAHFLFFIAESSKVPKVQLFVVIHEKQMLLTYTHCSRQCIRLQNLGSVD